MTPFRRFGPLALVVLLVVLLSIPGWLMPLQRDQGVYAACGSLLVDGQAPYASCWDTKAPLTHYTYALAEVLFGVSFYGPYVLNTLWTLATLAVLIAIARQWWPEQRWWGLGLLYGVLLIAIPFDMNAQTEGFANLPLALGVLLLSQGREAGSYRHYLAGSALLGLAGLYKYTLLLPAAVIGISAWATLPAAVRNDRRHWFGLAAASGAATFAVWGAAAGYLWLRGALPLLIEHIQFMLTWFPQVEVNPPLLLFPGETMQQLGLQRTIRELLRLPALYAIGFAGLGLALARRDAWWRWVLLAWTAGAIATVYPQQVFTLYHWTLLLPPMVLAVGVVWQAVRDRPLVWRTALVLALLANAGWRYYLDQWQLAGPLLLGQVTREALYTGQAVQDELDIAMYIKDRTTPDELIYVWGNHANIYYLSERQAPTRFIFNSPLMARIPDNPYQPAWLDEVLEALYDRPPTYFVVTWYDRTWFDYLNPVDQIAAMPDYQHFLDTYYREELFYERFAIHRLTPWWSRETQPDLFDYATVTDLLAEFGSATTYPAPNAPIAIQQISMPGDDSYPALFVHPEGAVGYDLTLPADGPLCFRADLAIDPQAWGWGSSGVRFGLRVDGAEVWTQEIGNTTEDQRWHPVLVDLSDYAGQSVELTLFTHPGPNGDFTGDQAMWGVPRIMRAPGATCEANALIVPDS